MQIFFHQQYDRYTMVPFAICYHDLQSVFSPTQKTTVGTAWHPFDERFPTHTNFIPSNWNQKGSINLPNYGSPPFVSTLFEIPKKCKISVPCSRSQYLQNIRFRRWRWEKPTSFEVLFSVSNTTMGLQYGFLCQLPLLPRCGSWGKAG